MNLLNLLIDVLALSSIVTAAALGIFLNRLLSLKRLGLLDLEERAARDGLVYLPVTQELAVQLADWSQPARILLEPTEEPLIYSLRVQLVS